MAKKSVKKDKCKVSVRKPCPGGCCAVYGLGFVGALVYYISTANGFWGVIWGFLKALVWPAFLIFHLMKSLGM